MQASISPWDLPDFTDDTLTVQPVERSDTIPSAWYVDPKFHAVDRDAIFARTWQGVGHLSQLGNPGDYFLATVADNPIIVLRDREGVLRAFYNVCRHRGGPLAIEPQGCVKALTCKYHGWTFMLDGSLRGVPQWDRVELFDKGDFGLVPVRVDTWEDFVFVNLAEEPAHPLGDVLAGIRERIAPIELRAKRFVKRIDYEVGANWKVYIDNYLEGYHIPHVHPELVNLLDFQRYNTYCHPHYSYQHTPLASGETVYSAGGGEAFYYWVFPNFMLNVAPKRVQANLVQPLGPHRCRVTFWYYYDDPDDPAQQVRLLEDIAFSDHVQQEDREICERVQQGLSSRAYDRGRFSVQMESAVHHFQALLKEAYRDWRAAESP
ncbi:MAG: aromatic ring-hydroxylating dioxygenase subunit alpha [Gemmatimonadota bacterium]